MIEDVLVIVPSRGRPYNSDEVLNSFLKTREGDSRILFALDNDDSTAASYVGGELAARRFDSDSVVSALNSAAIQEYAKYRYIGYIGDDNRFITPGWDVKIINALDDQGGGLVYTNDLMDPGALPTVVFMDSRIVRKLGYMAPPPLRSILFDNFWLHLGKGIGKIKYLPDVVIQHISLPPVKADPEGDKKDYDVWNGIVVPSLPYEINRVRELYCNHDVDKI